MKSTDNCYFCNVIGDYPCNLIVHECGDLIAFLDILPIRESHTQIVTKAHYDYFDSLPQNISHKIMDLGQRIAKAQKILYPVDRAGFLFTGGDVSHVHAHVLPLYEKTDITSLRYPLREQIKVGGVKKATKEELEKTTAALKQALQDIP